MSIQIVKKFPSLELVNHKTRNPTSRFVTPESTKPDKGHLLRLYISLMAPKTVPLVHAQTKELKPEQVCKFDWHFGICNHPNDWSFDWLEELRPERSLAVQVVIEIPDEIEFTEVYSDMMGLQPLNQTLQRKPDFIQVAADVGAAVAPTKLFRDEKEHQVGLEMPRPHAKITLSARLGFLENDPLCYIPEGQPEESTCAVDVQLTDPVHNNLVDNKE